MTFELSLTTATFKKCVLEKEHLFLRKLSRSALCIHGCLGQSFSVPTSILLHNAADSFEISCRLHTAMHVQLRQRSHLWLLHNFNRIIDTNTDICCLTKTAPRRCVYVAKLGFWGCTCGASRRLDRNSERKGVSCAR